MSREQHSLFDWFRARKAPRGAVSRSGVDEQAVSDEDVRGLHRRLEAALGTVDLVVTNNRKRMVTAKKKKGRHELRVHRMFVDADDQAVSALVGLARGDSSSRDELRRYIRSNRDAIEHVPPATALNTTGEVHDLRASLDRANQLLDGSEYDDLQITWGRRGRGSRSIRFGSYDFQQRLIRVHPALDEEWVPDYFVDFVVYHELLHVVVPPREDAHGRRLIHPPEFRELESRFPRYDEAMAWERANLKRLLSR